MKKYRQQCAKHCTTGQGTGGMGLSPPTGSNAFELGAEAGQASGRLWLLGKVLGFQPSWRWKVEFEMERGRLSRPRARAIARFRLMWHFRTLDVRT